MHRYDKTEMSKIQSAVGMTVSLPGLDADERVHVLADSWYSNKSINACLGKGFHFIGGLKTNRITYPCGVSISLSAYAKSLDKGSFGLVTAKARNTMSTGMRES
jgi:hypothetical protein